MIMIRARVDLPQIAQILYRNCGEKNVIPATEAYAADKEEPSYSYVFIY